VQILDDKPLVHLKPIVEKLLEDKDKNKQRGAAELLAGIVGGSTLSLGCCMLKNTEYP
jgi:proteasome activator subunit 4